MALIGNRSVLNKSPGRFLSGTAVSGDRNSFSKHGMTRNAYQQFNALSSLPEGSRSPVAWVMAKTNGGMVSRYDSPASVAADGTLYGGVTASGATSVVIDIAVAYGQLIASGDGSAAFNLATNNPLLTASISGSGSASITISINTPLLGALADVSGLANTSIATNAPVMYPLDDTSPHRNAAAAFSLAGSGTLTGNGFMVGSTIDTTGLTPQAVAAAVIAAAQQSPISSNIKQVNDVAVQGDGQQGSEWGPA